MSAGAFLEAEAALVGVAGAADLLAVGEEDDGPQPLERHCGHGLIEGNAGHQHFPGPVQALLDICVAVGIARRDGRELVADAWPSRSSSE